MNHLSIALCLAVVIFTKNAEGYAVYQDKIPNGVKVPHPCLYNRIWRGVGHFNVEGNGERNPFGRDFAANKHVWTEELCQKDSDGDGKTNGEELGDPACIWTVGDAPQNEFGLSHPGICEPLDSVACRDKDQSWLSCAEEKEFDCPALKEEGMQNVTLRFPETFVPPKMTTYMCMLFQFHDVSRNYHVVADQGYVHNSKVMHHMVVIGCEDDVELSDTPFECYNSPKMRKCQKTLALWSVGLQGECFHPDTGVLLGKDGFKKIMIQSHWTNPLEATDLVDSSGMTLFYTPNLRPNNMGVLVVGQSYLEIPPKRETIDQVGVCPSDCVRKIAKGPIQITSTFNHMHYLGVSMKIELNSGSSKRFLSDEPKFRYDTPKYFTNQNPVTVNMGDELITTCTYKSTMQKTTTYFGLGSFEEMCYGFLQYFPAENIETDCVAYKEYSHCETDEARTTGMFHGCNLRTFLNTSSAESLLFQKTIQEKCSTNFNCRAECKEALRTLRAEHPCFNNTFVVDYAHDTWKRWDQGRQLLMMLHSCDAEINAEVNSQKCSEHQNETDGGASFVATAVVLLFSYAATFLLN